MAAAHGVARAIRILLEAGADVDARDEVREPDLTDNHSHSPTVIQYRSLDEGGRMCVSVCDDLCVGQGREGQGGMGGRGGSVLGLAQYLPRIKELFEFLLLINEVTLLDPRSEC